ncbi:MAG: helix-turn-helix domain-containing protein [Chthoniobacterales bacterium]
MSESGLVVSSLAGRLTCREREVMRWVSEGKSDWEISQIVGCVEQTVKKHLQHIYRKLGVENRMAAVNCLRQYSEAGLALYRDASSGASVPAWVTEN